MNMVILPLLVFTYTSKDQRKDSLTLGFSQNCSAKGQGRSLSLVATRQVQCFNLPLTWMTARHQDLGGCGPPFPNSAGESIASYPRNFQKEMTGELWWAVAGMRTMSSQPGRWRTGAPCLLKGDVFQGHFGVVSVNNARSSARCPQLLRHLWELSVQEVLVHVWNRLLSQG